MSERGEAGIPQRAWPSGPPRAAPGRLRRDDPVHRPDMPDGTGYCAVTRYADVVRVARKPEGVLRRAPRPPGTPTAPVHRDGRALLPRVHLARLEARVSFEELAGACTTIELTGAPRRQRSNLNNTLKERTVRSTRPLRSR
ncbi:MAG: hypothetical protein U0V73_08895 [Acidimicrobiia bacterium]